MQAGLTNQLSTGSEWAKRSRCREFPRSPTASGGTASTLVGVYERVLTTISGLRVPTLACLLLTASL